MSPARSATVRSAPRPAGGRPSYGFGPRRVRSRAPLSRIRWDRAVRVGLIAVVMLVTYLWVSGIADLIGARAQADRGLAQVQRLASENRRLLAEESALHQRATVLDRARGLGMVRQGEQSFILTH